MNKLLIHNNNTAYNLPKFFPINEQLVFSLPVEALDVDVYMNNWLKGDLGEKLSATDVVFIKVALSENYLEYLGIRLAYHIRLTRSLGRKADLPIVFIAEENIQFLGMTCPDPSILFTRGIYHISENATTLDKTLDELKKGLLHPLADKQQFIDSIVIHPPANYTSHHSIANEWSLLRWARVLGLPQESSPLKSIKENIDNLLYYKYLLVRYPVEGEPDKGLYSIAARGKVLYIDDEWEKGWDFVLKELFKLSPGITFKSLEESFKDNSEEKILKLCETAIEAFDPDVVILDLRLTDTDFGPEKKPREMTGCKVLKMIKTINPGIRVIIFTASNKVWNLLQLQKEGANGFILKESPEYPIYRETTRKTIKQFADSVEEQLKYRFQKQLFKHCSQAETTLLIIDTTDSGEYKRLITELKAQIRIIRSSLLLIDLTNSNTLDIAFLSCFNFLEQLRSYYLEYDESDFRYYLGIDRQDLMIYEINGKLINRGIAPSSKVPSFFHLQVALFVDYFHISNTSLQEIRDLRYISDERNEFIHSSKPGFTPDELKIIMQLLLKVCEKLRE
jgi:DNA-binding NarL/FixJ family response regulator